MELSVREDSSNLNSRFLELCESSLIVKYTSGASLIINSSFLPSALRMARSGPSILYSTAESTGGPELNLSTTIFRSGFSAANFFASIGKATIISLYEGEK